MSLASRFRSFLARAIASPFGSWSTSGSYAGTSLRPTFGGDPAKALEAMTGLNGICVDTISEDLSAIGLEFFIEKASPVEARRPAAQRVATRKKAMLDGWVPVEKHPAATLFEKPNPIMGQSTLRYLTQAWLELAGNAMWWKRRLTPNGEPVELWPIPFHWVEAKVEGMQIVSWRFSTSSPIRQSDGSPYPPFPAKDFVHWQKPNPLNIWIGRGMVDFLNLNIDIDFHILLTNLGFFANGARLGGTMELPEWNKNLVDAWTQDNERKFGKPGSAHRDRLIPPGWKFTPANTGKRDLDFAQGESQQMRRIMMGYKISPAVLGDVSGLLRANVEAANFTYERRALLPRIRRFCQTMESGYLSEWDPGAGIWHCAFEDFITEDQAEAREWARLSLGGGTGITTSTINEIRENAGLVAYPDEKANKLFISQSFLALDEERPEPAPSPNMGDESPEEDPEAEEDPEENEEPPKPPKPEGEEGEDAEEDEGEEGSARSKGSRGVSRGVMPTQRKLDLKTLVWVKFLRSHTRAEAALHDAYRKVIRSQRDRVLGNVQRFFGQAPALFAAGVFGSFEREAERFVEAGRNAKRAAIIAAARETFVSLGVQNFDLPTKSIRRDLAGPGPVPALGNAEIARYIEEMSLEGVTYFNETTVERIREVYADTVASGGSSQEVSAALRETFKGVEGYRLERIARTEMTAAMNWSQLQAATATSEVLGVEVTKHWVSALDERVRDSHVIAYDDYSDGIPVDEPYVVESVDGQDEMMYPGDPEGSAANVVNCRCTQTFTIG